MRDAMRASDGVLYYHSSCAEPGIVGIAQVASTPYPGPTQFDAKSPYYDAKSKPVKPPRWWMQRLQISSQAKIALMTNFRDKIGL